MKWNRLFKKLQIRLNTYLEAKVEEKSSITKYHNWKLKSTDLIPATPKTTTIHLTYCYLCESNMESTRPVYVQRFLLDDSAVEEVEDYAPGGLHPTHLGDLLGEDGRYKVVLKLGHGGFGMVWLCRDTQRSKWKAVKILRASDSTEDCADLRIHSVFSDMDSQHTDIGHSRVAFALDHFWMEGPNGRHLCIVMPLLGPNLDNAARRYLYEEAPLMRICYQLVQAISFLHAKGVCHGDFRPQNACFTLKDIDDLEEEDIIRAFGRPKLVCLVDDGEFEWEDGSNGGAVEFNDEVYDVDDSDEQPEARPPRYLVSKSYLNPDSPFVSNNIAVIDFGESFLASEPPESTGIPCHYGAPETFIDKCGDLGFSSDLWALGCTICHVRVGSDPFFDVGDIWYLMSYWENLNGPLPEPYRSSLAEDFEVPEDLDQYVSTDLEEMEELKQEYLRRTGVTGSLHNILLIERRFHVLLQEGEEPSPPPPPTSSTRGQMREEPGHKIVAVEMSRREASQLLDLLKQTFAWQPSDRIPAAEILSLPWFAAYHEEEKQVSGSQPGAAVAGLPDEDDDIRATVPYCGMTPLFALLRGFLRLYGI